jgi:hypothetical protein
VAVSKPKRYVEIAGHKVKVASDAEAERADFYVCMRVSDMPVARFNDDLILSCARCGHDIRCRPYAPSAPLKICIHCACALG